MERVSDEVFKLVQRLTHATKMEDSIDIACDETHDYFYDNLEDKNLSLKEGFEIIAEGLAYSFQYEGFTDEEAAILEATFKEYVPDFEAPSQEYDYV